MPEPAPSHLRFTVNDQPFTAVPGTLLADFLKARIGDRPGTAVAIDGEVVPRSKWAATAVPDGADILLIEATQGG